MKTRGSSSSDVLAAARNATRRQYTCFFDRSRRGTAYGFPAALFIVEIRIKAKFQENGASRFLFPTELQKQSWNFLITPNIYLNYLQKDVRTPSFQV
jgi:hypothetical protein